MALVKNIHDDKQVKISTWLGLAIVPLSGFATDIFIPSMPAISADLHVSNLQVQLTLSFFLISFGSTQLIVGAILDSFGRYKAGLTALLFFVLASVVIANTSNIFLIYGMRMVHGITAATIVVAKRAFFVDTYQGEKLKNYLSVFTIIWSVGPIVAPFVGGYLQNSFGWHSNFYFLAVLAGFIGIMEMLFSKESLLAPVPFNLKRIFATYLEMLSTANFILGLVMLGLGYSMVMIYNLTGPFILGHDLHKSPVIIGYCSLFLGFAWTAGGLIGKATIDKPFFSKLMINLIIQLVFGIGMVLIAGHFNSLFTILFFAFIIHTCGGYTFNNYFTFNMSLFPKNAGIAGGMIGGIVYIIISGLTYGIIKVLPAKDEYNLSYSYIFLIAASALVMFFLYRLNRIKKPGSTILSVH